MRRLRVPLGGVSAVAFLADGRLVTGDHAGKVLAHPPAGKPRLLLGPSGDRGVFRAAGWVAASADGRLLAIRRRAALLVLDPLGDAPVRRLTAAGLDGRTAALSPDGRLAAAFAFTLIAGRRVGLIDAATGTERVLTRRLGTVRRLAVAPDGSLLAAYAATLFERGLVVVRTADGERVGRVPLDIVPAVLQFVPGSRRLVWSEGPRVFAAGPPDWRPELLVRHGGDRAPDRVRACAFGPDGRLLATARLFGPGVSLWDAASGRSVAVFDAGFPRVLSLAVAPDGLTLAAGGSNRDVVVFDLDG